MLKKLILIRGVAGAGKTTLAQEMYVMTPNSVIISADDYFYKLGSGTYKFDASKLAAAHSECKRKTLEALLDHGIGSVIVHNTFTTEKELKPYLEMVETLKFSDGIVCELTSLIVENRHGNSSVHNVPDETITKMKNRFSVKL